MALIKNIVICFMFFLICIPCTGAKKEKHITVVKANRGYVVKMNGKTINHLYVITKYQRNKREHLALRVVLNHGYIPNKGFAKVDYRDFLFALGYVLKKGASTYNINNLTSIEIDLISLGEECLRITSNYKRKFKKNEIITPKKVLSVLWRSRLIADIQQIVSNYHLKVNNIIVEMPFFTDWEVFMDYNKMDYISPNSNTNKVLRAIVYIYLK